MSEQERIVTQLEALLDAHNLDDQLNAALALVRAIRAKRLKLALEIQEHLEKNQTTREGELKL
jgi:hypothetical protein